jgi:predicted ABC-type sugar transport system permease subunit
VKRVAIGSALAATAGAAMIVPLLIGWEGLPRPWGFLLGLVVGLTGGTGVALAVCGLVQCSRGSDA